MSPNPASTSLEQRYFLLEADYITAVLANDDLWVGAAIIGISTVAPIGIISY